MRIVCTLLLCLASILNSIGLGSQSKCLRDGAPSSSFPSSPSGHCLDTTLATSSNPAISPPPAELTSRARSRSPSLRQTFPSVLGYTFDDLALIRLRPHNSPNRVFKLERYVFPQDKPVGLKTRFRDLNPMPHGEQIVLSTFNGDICPILAKKSSRNTILRGIFTSLYGLSVRAKINMNSGAVVELTSDEIEKCPVSHHEVVTKLYRVIRLSSESERSSDGDVNPVVHRSEPSSPPTLKKTFPKIFGVKFNELASARMIPHNNPHKIFKFGRYVFPRDEPIGMKAKNRVLNPMPITEQLVLSTSNGDVCGILVKSNSHAVLRGIFTRTVGILERVKINMNSGAVVEMSSEEIATCPLSGSDPITKFYRVLRV